MLAVALVISPTTSSASLVSNRAPHPHQEPRASDIGFIGVAAGLPHLAPEDRRTEAVAALAVRRVKMEVVLSGESTTIRLSFAVENRSSRAVTDVYVMARLLKPSHDAGDSMVLAGPFLIRITEPLPAGYSFECEIDLRPLPDDCKCVPDVEVVSARFSSDP